MTESLLILNLLTLGICGGVIYFAMQNFEHRLESVKDFYEKVIIQLQDEKVHLYNCFLDKQNKPPLGTDLKKEREQRIEEANKKKENQVEYPVSHSPIKDAQMRAQLQDAGVKV